jgi:hypothetical protein
MHSDSSHRERGVPGDPRAAPTHRHNVALACGAARAGGVSAAGAAPCAAHAQAHPRAAAAAARQRPAAPRTTRVSYAHARGAGGEGGTLEDMARTPRSRALFCCGLPRAHARTRRAGARSAARSRRLNSAARGREDVGLLTARAESRTQDPGPGLRTTLSSSLCRSTADFRVPTSLDRPREAAAPSPVGCIAWRRALALLAGACCARWAVAARRQHVATRRVRLPAPLSAPWMDAYARTLPAAAAAAPSRSARGACWPLRGVCPAHAACSAAAAPLRRVRLGRPPAASDAGSASGTPAPTAALTEQEELEWQRTITGPRMEAGLDVHRRLHAQAGRHPGYLFQWRAFCERQQRSWQDTRSSEDEAIMAGAQQPHCRAAGRALSAARLAQCSTTKWRRVSSSSRRTRLAGDCTSGRNAGVHDTSARRPHALPCRRALD